MSHDDSAADTVAADEPQFLKVPEVAMRLRISRSTAYNLIADGLLPAHRTGRGKVRPRGLRVPAAAVEEYLNGSLIAPAEEVA